MNPQLPLPYQENSTVYVKTGTEKIDVLDDAIAASGFIPRLEKQFLLSGKKEEDFLVVIKANIMEAPSKTDAAAFTDPELVEHLAGVIRSHGYSNIAVADSENLLNCWYPNRTVHNVAGSIGYQATNYNLIDLADDQAAYDYGSVLGMHTIARAWLTADYRISFGKNKTDCQCFYTGCLKNIYGCLPRFNRISYYKTKNIRFYEACVLVATHFPVHFGFLDAWDSGCGFSSSIRKPKVNTTNAVLASPNILALDWVQGEKMGLNPALNFLLQEALLRWGTVQITRKGNMTPWEDWQNIRSLTVGLWGVLEVMPALHHFISKLIKSTPILTKQL
jgi:uncharacterized protein (DUF362 family)